MIENTMTKETSPVSKTAGILRQVVKWSILLLVLFTCIMAAYGSLGADDRPRPARRASR